MKVCHHCDNPSCVRPDHLFLGTQADNVQDCVMKGRHKNPSQNGSRNPSAKLKEEDVLMLRQMASEGASANSLSIRFGVTPRTIRKIVSGTRWAHC